MAPLCDHIHPGVNSTGARRLGAVATLVDTFNLHPGRRAPRFWSDPRFIIGSVARD